MSWLLYQLVYNPACLVVPGGAWMGSCIAERGLFRGHYWLLTLGQALPNWSSENQKEFSSSFPKKKKKFKISKYKKKFKTHLLKPPFYRTSTHDDQVIDSLRPCLDKEPVLPRSNVNGIAANTRFLILSFSNNDMSKQSPFAIHKALIGIGGEPNSVKRLRSGDLLIETNSALQTKSFLLAKSFLDSPITISPHKTLNSCRGVISESDLLTTPDAEILDGFSDQGVIQVRRITIKKIIRSFQRNT
ncbi:uncharacterized protein TNCV_4570211 [Trichonephila clavipes]|nr:uncharacterized protein TNCV_4570211 [Trichonephila clavipes]